VRRTCFTIITALALGLLAACRPSMPDEPQARLERVAELVREAPTGHKGAVWLAFLAHDYRPETRQFLLDIIRDGRTQEAKEAIMLLDDEGWMKDDELRRELRAYYLDDMRSYYRREKVRLHVFLNWQEKYQEFRSLPDRAPINAKLVHIGPESTQ
jgi:hypothetical protein